LPSAPGDRTGTSEKAAPPGKGDGDRARALLEGRSAPTTAARAVASASTAAAAAAEQRFVVQVGAYGDAATLREVRAKVEKLGLKTYTQVVQTAGGPRTRVRVGPFGSRQEAEKANDTLAAAGLRGNLLTL
jgi:DedD protein